MAVLTVATCQFPVGADIGANLRHVRRQMAVASRRGARVAHFPEGALSGYAGTDFESFDGYDWDRLRDATAEVAEHARRLGLWVVLGSAHQLTSPHKPHNSLYVIGDSGQFAERYDKRFCGGDPDERLGDLAHYSPGGHFSVWHVDGVCCGALICYDYRYPELYREYGKRGVQLMFHSFHAANASPDRIAAIGAAIGTGLEGVNRAATHTYPGITMPAAMTTAAACNHVWISCPNSSAPESCWPAFFVRADGITTGRLRRNVAGVLISTVDTEQQLYDSTAAWRERAMAGVLHSGTLVSDPRSDDRTRVLYRRLPSFSAPRAPRRASRTARRPGQPCSFRGVIVAVSSMPVSRIAAKSRSITIDGLPASSSQMYFCVVPSLLASSRWLSPASSLACCRMRPSDSGPVTFPLYAMRPSDYHIEVAVSDYLIGVSNRDVDMNVIYRLTCPPLRPLAAAVAAVAR